MKKAIAMRCSQENWDSIKDRILKEGFITSIETFSSTYYLTNFFMAEENSIANIRRIIHNEEIHETFNAKIFLDACGIETKPTLEEVKEYFKDAETIESLFGDEFQNKYEFTYSSTNNGIYAKNGSFQVWYPEKGYAKILTYKEQKFEITKEQIFELKRRGNQLVDEKLTELFPEVFKKELEVGKYYKYPSYPKFITFIKENKTRYGIDVYGRWFDNADAIEDLDGYVEATAQEVETALICEAKKRGYKNGTIVNSFVHNKNLRISRSHKIEYISNNYDKLHFGEDGHNCVVVYEKGQWATIIQPEKMTHEQIEKELGRKIQIV